MAFLKIFRLSNFSGSVFSYKTKRAWSKGFFEARPGRKIIFSMRTAYIQHEEGDEKVLVSVNFTDLNMNKVLHFERNILEKLVDFMKRVDGRLETLYSRKIVRKKKELIQDLPVFKTSLLLNNERISDELVFKDLFENDFNGDLKLKILENEYNVFINAPMVESITLPKLLFVGGSVFPENFQTKCTDINQSDFIWYKSRTPQKEKGWEKCGEGLCYIIKENDLNHYIKLSCTPKMQGREGPTVQIVSETVVEKLENFDEIKKRQELTKEKTGINEVRIVTYNILADMYVNTKEAKTEIFTFCNPSYLEYGYRKCLLNTEIQGYNADIICLQEVERKYFHTNLFLFNNWGYECIFHEKEGTREGCALLYNRNKLHLKSSKQYNFTNEILNNVLFSDIKSKIESNPKLIGRLLNVLSQIQVTVLQGADDHILVIGNVHFYFHPDADHIRLLQGIISLKILLNTVEVIKKEEQNKNVSVVLCGDFNSTPECGFHKLLTEGSVDSNQICWRSKEDEEITDVSCSHSLKMRSCYDYSILTNFTPSFKACLDYIYFQCDHLELKQTVPVPSVEVLSKNIGIPSQFFPSDHVALIADFKFKNENEK